MEVPIILIVFGSFVFSLKMIIDYRRERLSALASRTGSTEGSLGASELKRLIREAVDEAVRPLVDRLDERRSDRLPGTRPQLALNASADVDRPETVKAELTDS